MQFSDRFRPAPGHAATGTTGYVSHSDDELATEHPRIGRLLSNPLSRAQHRRHQRAAAR